MLINGAMESSSRRVSPRSAPLEPCDPYVTPPRSYAHSTDRLAQVRSAIRGAPRLPVRRALSTSRCTGEGQVTGSNPALLHALTPPAVDPRFALACCTFDAPASAL